MELAGAFVDPLCRRNTLLRLLAHWWSLACSTLVTFLDTLVEHRAMSSAQVHCRKLARDASSLAP